MPIYCLKKWISVLAFGLGSGFIGDIVFLDPTELVAKGVLICNGFLIC